MAKKLSAWNMFVKKVYGEGKAKNKSYKFRDALKDASKRKGEMGSSSPTKKRTKSRKGGVSQISLSIPGRKGGGTRKRRKSGGGQFLTNATTRNQGQGMR